MFTLRHTRYRLRRRLAILICDCIFSSLDDFYFAGDEIIRTNKRNEEDTKETRSRISSHTTSTIAEEAVDQLQASEKLIAGN